MMSEEANCDQSTDTKTDPTDAPAQLTDVQTEQTDIPAQLTDVQTEQTDIPAQPTDAHIKHKVMSVEDWAEKCWQAGNLEFHKDHVHTLLENHMDQLLDGREGLKILVPLCGKSLDIKWLADKGHTVIGIEGVEQAILELFTEQNLDYTKETLQDIDGEVYKTSDGKIRIYKCDVFDFNRSLECDIDAVWDRSALTAINFEDRERYVSVIKSVASSDCRMFVATLDYDATLWPGPPPYIPEETVAKIYGGDEYSTEVLARQDLFNDRWRSRGLSYFFEVLHFLKKKTS